MAAAQGFVTVSPDAMYGDSGESWFANYALVQTFTCGGTGAQELSEIGFYASSAAGVTLKMAVFTDDAANGCPDVMVANSEVEITFTSASTLKRSASYSGTKPQVTGGSAYWLCQLGNANWVVSAFAAAGVKYKAATYPTWPTGDGWHSPSTDNKDLSFYAVYAAAAGAAPVASPASLQSVHRFGPHGLVLMG